MTASLVERVETAAEGSRELDAEICVLFQYGGANSEGATDVRVDLEWGDDDLLFEVGNEKCCNPVPPVTTSLDAALALAERFGFDLIIILERVMDRARRYGSIPTTKAKLTRFVCAAILRAHEASK